MEHLNTHAHAYIDKDNKVVNILVFQEKDHDSDLLNDFLPFNNAVKVVCCCSFGLAGIGHTWTGTEFQTPATPRAYSLELWYDRQPGTTRIATTVALQSVSVTARP